MPSGYDVVGVIGVGHHLAALLDLGGDGGEFLPAEPLAQNEVLAIRRLERGLIGVVVEHGEPGRVVDLGHRFDILALQIVRKRQADERNAGDDRSHEDERRAPAALARAAVGDGAEQRQKEQRQNVVERHDHAGGSLRHAEFVGENLRYDRIICLPEGADQEKGKSDKDGAFVVELHAALH